MPHGACSAAGFPIFSGCMLSLADALPVASQGYLGNREVGDGEEGCKREQREPAHQQAR